MKAAILLKSKQKLKVANIDLPKKLFFGQILVKIMFSGICGAQINEIDAVKGKDKFLPHLLGHEGSGIVEIIGEGVTKVKPGDHVVYPTHGVGFVQGIERETIDGHNLHLVVVTFDNERMILRIPTNKLEASGLREISSPKVMDAALVTLKGRARIKRTMWSRRAQEYELKINSRDPDSIAQVVRDLHRNVGQPDQSFSERQIYEMALERLASEVAALDGTDVATATEKLESILKSV